jgi:transposase-like protein
VSLPLWGDSHDETNSTITSELLDQLVANYKKPEDLTGEDGLFRQIKKALIERALGVELTEHLGYERAIRPAAAAAKAAMGRARRGS